ncbi:MAG: class I SAM-dependent methyltransferase [Lentisphaerota bacterium]
MKASSANVEYNNQADSYSSMAILQLARTYMEIPTFMQLAGNIKGKSCLDFACGSGFYSRMLSRLGAKYLLGVDISSKMVDIAKSYPNPLDSDIEYICSDLFNFKTDKRFDLVTGIYLLHYMQNQEVLREVIKAAYDNLDSKGSFISFNISPNINQQKGYYEKYQVDFEFPDIVKDGTEFKFTLKIYPDKPLLFTCYYWSKEVIEDAFHFAGFKSIEWISPKVSSYGKIVLGHEYWQPMIDNPWCLFIKAQKE